MAKVLHRSTIEDGGGRPMSFLVVEKRDDADKLLGYIILRERDVKGQTEYVPLHVRAVTPETQAVTLAEMLRRCKKIASECALTSVSIKRAVEAIEARKRKQEADRHDSVAPRPAPA